MKRSEIVEKEAVKLTDVLNEYEIISQQSYQSVGQNQVRCVKTGASRNGRVELEGPR